MEEFSSRLREDAQALFENRLPDLCRRFHSILNSDQFSDASILQVKEHLRKSCRRLKLDVESNEDKIDLSSLPQVSQRTAQEENASSGDDHYFTPVNSDSELEVKEPKSKKQKLEKQRRKRKLPKEEDSDKSDSDEESTPEAVLECNPLICGMIEVLKPELRAVTECCNTVRAWVQLQIPAMQDGNNFGVEVQGDMIEEVRRVEGESSAFLQALSLYYLTRADLASKFVKSPGVGDFVRALEELDGKEVVSLRLVAREVRNSCVGLLDSLSKNMDKIVCPRSSNDNMLVC